MTGPADLVGSVIAERYRVLRLLGSGSMGAVYEVEQLGSGQRAAMKTLGPQGREDRELGARLVREAKAMSLFEHRNIVALLDVVWAGEAMFVVTELVRGVSLREVMEDGFVEPRRALAIARQVLEALDHAHARGVVHRDIKPENIMLADGGAPDRDADLVKMLDFGVAKLLDDTRALLGEGKLTRTDQAVFGAPLYTAPELVLGRPADARADLYSVGVLLFELLAGRPPFHDPDPVALLRLHASAAAPALRELAPERSFTPELEYVVAEALAKKPELRFASATDMITAVDAAASSLDPEPVAAPLAPQQPLLAPQQPLPAPQQPLPAPQQPLPAPQQPLPAPQQPPASAPPSLHGTQLALVPPPPSPAASPQAPAGPPAPSGRARGLSAWAQRRAMWALGGTIASVILIASIAALVRGGPEPAKGQPGGASTAAGAKRAAGSAGDAGALLADADERTRRGRHLDAVAALERALLLDPALARDPQLRSRLTKVLETRDTAAAMVALELLATRVDPPARDAIAAKAAAAAVREIRWRAFAIAERDGYGDQIDRLESWSKDLRQATTCDERRAVIARLLGLADKRAIAALRRARDEFPCIARDAGEAITQLQAGP